MHQIYSTCLWCKHLRKTGFKKTCKAFPDGIPEDMFPDEMGYSGFHHDEPYPNDNGIRFELETDYEKVRENLPFRRNLTDSDEDKKYVYEKLEYIIRDIKQNGTKELWIDNKNSQE